MKHFASDNYAGVHPKIMQALSNANGGHTPAYGYGAYTEQLQGLLKQHFGEQAVGFPVFNGTGANVLGLQSLIPRWGSVICAQSAHIHNDESNAPQTVGGLKLWTIPTDDGKLSCQMIDEQAYGFGNEHRSQPAVVYISQTTECGTCYSIDELAALAETTHRYGMKLFVDGARLSNAAAQLDCGFHEMITQAGVDMVSLGGTKNGLMFGECLVDVTGNCAKEMKFLRKMSMQTASKMRFVSAQLVAMLEDGFYKDTAKHANLMAQKLAQTVRNLGIEVIYAVESNAVFVRLPSAVAEQVSAQYHFYEWGVGTYRLMCSFDTTEEDVLGFGKLLQQALSEHQ